MKEETWRRIAELWLSNDYSPVGIRQTIGSVTLDQVEVAIRQVNFVTNLVAEGIRLGMEDVLRQYEMPPHTTVKT